MGNINPPKLCDGTRLQILKLQPNLIEARILTSCGTGKLSFILRISIICSEYEFEFKLIQFPV